MHGTWAKPYKEIGVRTLDLGCNKVAKVAAIAAVSRETHLHCK